MTFPEGSKKRAQYVHLMPTNPTRYYIDLPDKTEVFVAEQDDEWCVVYANP